MSSLPAHSTDPLHPFYYVTGSGSGALFQWDRGDAAKQESFVQSGTIDPGPTAWSDGRLSGNVYRFVTWSDDASTPTSQDVKRVTIAVTVNGEGGPSRPTLLSSIATPS